MFKYPDNLEQLQLSNLSILPIFTSWKVLEEQPWQGTVDCKGEGTLPQSTLCLFSENWKFLESTSCLHGIIMLFLKCGHFYFHFKLANSETGIGVAHFWANVFEWIFLPIDLFCPLTSVVPLTTSSAVSFLLSCHVIFCSALPTSWTSTSNLFVSFLIFLDFIHI